MRETIDVMDAELAPHFFPPQVGMLPVTSAVLPISRSSSCLVQPLRACTFTQIVCWVFSCGLTATMFALFVPLANGAENKAEHDGEGDMQVYMHG